MLRARGRFRWVAVLDFDEYLVPKQAQTIGEVFQQIHTTSGHCSAQYTFTGRVVCSGCRHQYHTVPGAGPTEQPLPVREGPHPFSSAVLCLQPTVGFHHILWSTVTADAADHLKSVVDPMAVMAPGVHSSSVGSFKGCSGTVQLAPSQVGGMHISGMDRTSRC